MLVYSPDGSRILAANGSKNTSNSTTCAQIWDARTCEPLQAVLSHPGLRRAQFDAAGDKVLTVGFIDDGAPKWKVISGQAKLGDARTGKLLLGPILHGTRPVSDAAISPDGSVIATIGGASISPDGRLVARSSMAGDASQGAVWDVNSGQMLFSVKDALNGMPLFSPDGSKVLFDVFRGAALWDIPSRRPIKLPDDLDRSVAAFSPDGKHLAIHSFHGFTSILELEESPQRVRPRQ